MKLSRLVVDLCLWQVKTQIDNLMPSKFKVRTINPNNNRRHPKHFSLTSSSTLVRGEKKEKKSLQSNANANVDADDDADADADDDAHVSGIDIDIQI